jgi:hypothetical protein
MLLKQDAWRRAAAIASLGAAVIFASLVVLMIALNRSPPSTTLGSEFWELVSAAQQPTLYRAAITFDILAWLAGGAVIVCFGGLLAVRRSLRGVALAVCGIGTLAGALGAFLRLAYTTGLAGQLGGEPAHQQVVLELYRGAQMSIFAHFHAGSLFTGIGLLVLASAGLRMPRWILASLWLLGGYTMVSVGAALVGPGIPVFPWQLLRVLITVAQFFGLAWAMRADIGGASTTRSLTSPLTTDIGT